jgi:hypothetical protein
MAVEWQWSLARPKPSFSRKAGPFAKLLYEITFEN